MDIKFPLRDTAAVSNKHLKCDKLFDQQVSVLGLVFSIYACTWILSIKLFCIFCRTRKLTSFSLLGNFCLWLKRWEFIKQSCHIRKAIYNFKFFYFPPLLLQVFRTLVNLTKDINGAKVENHKFCASVHYRNVDEQVKNAKLASRNTCSTVNIGCDLRITPNVVFPLIPFHPINAELGYNCTACPWCIKRLSSLTTNSRAKGNKLITSVMIYSTLTFSVVFIKFPYYYTPESHPSYRF